MKAEPDMSTGRVIIFCKCASRDIIDPQVVKSVKACLEKIGCSYYEVDDLCKICAQKHDIVKQCNSAGEIVVIGCYERAIRSLLAAGGANLDNCRLTVHNMRESSAEQICAELENSCPDVAGKENLLTKCSIVADKDAAEWYPVIDYNRCARCGQCYNFCLFGVFSLDDKGMVKVTRPQNCKTNCPACAKVCPQRAIIFPKHPEKPINGSDVTDDDLDNAAQELAGGDIQQMLIQRSLKKQTLTKNDPAKLMSMKEQLSIPDEVIQSIKAEGFPELKCPNSSLCDKDCKQGDAQN